LLEPIPFALPSQFSKDPKKPTFAGKAPRTLVQIQQFRGKCIGCHYCVEVAPERWRMSERDGKSDLVGAVAKSGVFRVEVQDWELEANREAERLCPVKIIRVLER